MSRGRLADWVTVVAFAAVSALAAGLIAFDPVSAAPVRVDIRIRYSHFDRGALTVPYGRPVTFVLHNDDPIEHEWLVGDEEMHRVHRTGTEAHHGSRPTEVSIPPLTTIETTVTFTEPVAWNYICHLPGHEAYGMVGLLTAR
ncbi:MAG: plastocyanin/azurin family copper-binding protein [Chloroflexota bacterium]